MIARVSGLFCVVLVLLVLPLSGRGADKEATENARGRMDAAKKMYEATFHQWKELAKDPMRSVQGDLDDLLRGSRAVRSPPRLASGPSDLEFFSRWSIRWLEAQSDLSEKPEDRAKAAEEHLARMKELEKTVAALVKKGLLDPIESVAAEFHRLEAEKWVRERKAR
jgi:hypothetical protein